MSAPYLALPENLVLMAGAGAGKTHGLISLSLHALGGARPSGEPLPPARLCAVTFTEKAAAEMKERLRQRVRALADGKGNEPELEASFAHYGRTPPPREFWEKVHANLSAAFVGTFHSFCAQLLRRFPAEAQLEPGFGLLEEGEATELFARSAEETVLRALEGEGEPKEEAQRLIRAVGYRGQGDFGASLLDLLKNVHERLSEDGRSATALPEPVPGTSFLDARDALIRSFKGVLELPKGPLALDAVMQSCREAIDVLASCGDADAERALTVAREVGKGINLTSCGKAAKATLKELRDEQLEAFELACGDAIAAPLHRDFVHTLVRAERAYREEKERRGVLDFTDLVRRARDLLRDVPAVRLETQGRIGVLFVDECQDTNRLQLDLVALLCERRAGAARTVKESAFDELPLEPAMLACVGDRKQSIYEFRGADVSVFVDIAARLRSGEGRVEFLKHNRRSRPALLRFFNRLFTRVMAPLTDGSAPHWRVVYLPDEDDLTPWRPEGPSGACVEVLAVEGEDSDQKRAEEARAVASRIAELLSPTGPAVVGVDREGAALRPAQGKDIVILLRRFRHLDLFRRELLARSIPHVVVHGGGFYAAQEVLDLRSLLALLADPTDLLALCAVLRSPFVTLSDPTLALLASNRRLSLEELKKRGIRDLATEEEQARLTAFLEVLERTHPIAHRLGVAATLESFIDALDLEPVLAATFEGEQKVANVRKLLAWAKAANPPGPGAAARQLDALAQQAGREGQATLLEESDPGAVRIMTVHQSKGLEFPVVFVPECGARARNENDSVLFDRQHGLCVRPRGEDGESIATSAAQRVQGALRSRQAAELDRLFYVAATRARDLLIFSGELSRGAPSWRTHLDRFVAEEPEAASLVRMVAMEGGTPALPAGDLPLPPPGPEAVAPEVLLAKTAPPGALKVRSLIAPVTQLSDFATCARKHYLAHTVGLDEVPKRIVLADEEELDGGDANAGEMKASDRGSLVHRALELMDFAKPPEEQVRAVLEAEGFDPEKGEAKEIAADVLAFVETPLGREFATMDGRRLRRELPFVLAVGRDEFTLHVRGTLDVLAIRDDGSALILDYKHTHAKGRGADAYGFQLACYALAMRAVLPGEVPIQAGIAFLKDRGSPPAMQTLDNEDLRRFEESLVTMGRELLERQRTREFPTLTRSRCEALKCGFVYHCHGARQVAQQAELFVGRKRAQ